MADQEPQNPIDKELRDAELRVMVADEAKRLYRDHKILGFAVEKADKDLTEEQENLAKAREAAKRTKSTEDLNKVTDSLKEVHEAGEAKAIYGSDYDQNLADAKKQYKDHEAIYQDMAFDDALLDPDRTEEIHFGGRSTEDYK
jgi:hypothetical protein